MILYYFGLCRASISRKMNAKKLEIRARGGRQELEVAALAANTNQGVPHREP